MFEALKKNHLKRKYNKYHLTKEAFDVYPLDHEWGKGKGADVWGIDWLIPVAEEFEWHFYVDRNTRKQYLVTKLTDYILGIFPFTYDEFIYELPKNHFSINGVKTEDVVKEIALLEKWTNHQDKVYCETNYSCLTIAGDKLVDISNGDGKGYLFIRTKE